MTSSVHQLPVNNPAKATGKPEHQAPPSYGQLPEAGFLLINQIVKVPGMSGLPLIPMSRSSWLAGVKAGKYPQPVKLGSRRTAWRVEDIKRFILEFGGYV